MKNAADIFCFFAARTAKYFLFLYILYAAVKMARKPKNKKGKKSFWFFFSESDRGRPIYYIWFWNYRRGAQNGQAEILNFIFVPWHGLEAKIAKDEKMGILLVKKKIKGKIKETTEAILFFAPGLISRSVLRISKRVLVREKKTRKGYSFLAAIPGNKNKLKSAGKNGNHHHHHLVLVLWVYDYWNIFNRCLRH